MKKYLLVLLSILFFFFSLRKTQAQQTVSNGAATTAINFPAGSCTYTWTNNNSNIGLAASGTGNIPSFKAVNTGSSPVTATITGTPVGTGGFAYIVNAGSNNVSVINTATNAVVATIPVGSNPNGICVDPNYNEVYVVNNGSNTVSVINTLTNTVTNTIQVGPTPWSVTVSRDGSQAFVSDGGDNNVEVINTTTNTIVANIPAGTNPNASAASPNGSLLYVNSANSVLVINTTTQAIVATIPVGSAPQAILITPDGSKVYSADFGSNNVYVINTSTNTVAGIIPVGVNPGGGSVSPDGSIVYIANLGSNSVSVISTTTNTVIKTIPVGSGPWGVSVRPDGTQIYVSNSGSNDVSVINASTNAILATIPVGSTPFSFGSFFTGGMNCTDLVTYTITVNPTSVSSPTITVTAATGPISACAGTASVSPQIQQFTVSGTGLTGSITATAPAGFEVSLAAGSGYSNTVTLSQTGGTVSNVVVYVRSAATAPTGSISGNVTLTSEGASSQTVSVTGLVNPNVMASLVISASENNICAGTPVTFTANPTNGGSSPVYQWLLNGDNAGTDSPSFSSSTLLNGDMISCRLTSNAACLTISDATSNVITMVVNTPAAPVASALSVCQGSSASLSVASPQTGLTYNWYSSSAETTLLFTGSTFITGAIVSDTTFYVVAENGACSSVAAAVHVTLNTAPPAPAVTNASVTTCSGQTVTLSIANPQADDTYNWYAAAAGGTPLATGVDYSVPIAIKTTTYYAEAANSSGCPSSTRTPVNVVVTPLAAVSAQGVTICTGTAATLTATSTDPNAIISWYDSSTGGTALATGGTYTTPVLSADTTFYVAAADNSSSCTPPAPTVVTVTVLQPLVAPVVVVASVTESTIKFQWTAVPGATGYQVSTDNGQTFSNPSSGETGLNTTITGLQPGQSVNVIVQALGSQSCQLSANSAPVTGTTTTAPDNLIYVPNVFTPNGDGTNDVVHVHSENIASLQFFIYDQWGELIFTSSSVQNGWDGTYKGTKEPVGVYVYYLKAVMTSGQNITKKGSITLLR
jgi:gliding motility-associated-like protein